MPQPPAWGALFGAVSSVASNFWLLFFQSFSVWTLGGVTLAYVAYLSVLAPLLRFIAGAPGSGPRRTPPAMPRAYRPIAVAVMWTLYEYLKSSGYLGYPWGLIAYPVHALTPLVQFVDITGVWGLSLLMALVNAVAAEWLDLALDGRRPPRVPGTPAAGYRGRGTVGRGRARLRRRGAGAPPAALRRPRRGAGATQRQPVAERRRRRRAGHAAASHRRRTGRGAGARPGRVERDGADLAR